MNYHISFDLELRRNPFSGLYIAVEGIDGAGKSTQIERLKKYFEEKGREVVLTFEPHNSVFLGETIRNILQKKITVPSEALQYLYTANRIVNHKEVVEPALQKGAVVISHRCFWSAVPYGVHDKGGQDYDYHKANIIYAAQGILSLYHQFMAPDITFYLQVFLDTAMNRLAERKSKAELYEQKSKLGSIIRGYEWQVEQFPEEFAVIDAERSIDETSNEIIRYIQNLEFKIKN